MSSSSLEVPFRCSICLDVFEDPASIPCGHNFCLGCVQRVWDTRDEAECPLCKETFEGPPGLRVNVGLRDIVEQFKRMSKDRPSIKSPPSLRRVSKQNSRSDDVFCVKCFVGAGQGQRTPAAKSCPACRESYCERHLVPHLRDPALTGHAPTDPGAFDSGRACQRHAPLACPASTEHERHEVVSVEVESGRIRSEMMKAQEDFTHMIQARTMKAQELQKSLDLSKRQKEEDVQKSLQVYATLKEAMDGHQGALVQESEAEQDEMQKKTQELQEELNQEVNEIQRRRREMRQLERIRDPLHLAQSFAALAVPSATGHLSQMKLSVSVPARAARAAFSRTVDVCLQLQTQLTTEELNALTAYAGETNDIESNDIESNDIESNDTESNDTESNDTESNDTESNDTESNDTESNDIESNDIESNDIAVSVSQKYSKNDHLFQVGDKPDWDLGVSKESLNRRGAVAVRPDCGFWAICRRDGGPLSACPGPSVPLALREGPRNVAIFLDYDEDEVSFYDAGDKVHIYTFRQCGFDEALRPYFSLCLRDGQGSTGALAIGPL
ncbi:E3 ubiquitin-protein ligase TRIM58-like [Eucyclogobius newberryi]|uniref:E3 ubiquitin-protein ligase TRIM58-like n=1 Tax=Eucyclogobius newberryi TaxID=166745 RepID=UPI003B5B32D9